MTREPLRNVTADEMFQPTTESIDQSKMPWSEYHPMYSLNERLKDLNNQAVFFMSIEDATKRAIKGLKEVYGEITWGFAAEQLQPYPYLREGLKRLRKRNG